MNCAVCGRGVNDMDTGLQAVAAAIRGLDTISAFQSEHLQCFRTQLQENYGLLTSGFLITGSALACTWHQL